jgi:UDP-glucuronate decarboxylase
MKKINTIIEHDCIKILRRIDITKAKKKKILITGANGFLGQYLIATLSLANRKIDLDCQICGIDLNDPRFILQSLISKDKNLNYHKVDLTKRFNLPDYDYIFHAAGYGQPARFVNDPYPTININIDATHNLLMQSPEATFIFFSSAEVYGNIPPKMIPVNEGYNGNCSLHTPRSVYCESKRLGESLCMAYAKNNKTKIKIVRISHVYGPGLPVTDNRVMSEFIKKALIDKEIKMLDRGKSVKTYGYIADTISMILFIAFYGQELVYNVGGKDSISILNLAKKIGKYCHSSYEIPSNITDVPHIGKDPNYVRLDLKKILHEMKKFNFTKFSDGLANTIEWTKSQLSD